jgi:hypothetical protein
LPQTALLLGYSAAHLSTAASAADLLLRGLHGGGWRAEGGMAVVALLAGALVYDNALVASGRFIGQARCHIRRHYLAMIFIINQP